MFGVVFLYSHLVFFVFLLKPRYNKTNETHAYNRYMEQFLLALLRSLQ